MATKEKRSFFERLTGTVKLDDDENEVSVTESRSTGGAGGKFKKVGMGNGNGSGRSSSSMSSSSAGNLSSLAGDADWIENESQDAELTVDVFQTPDSIVIKAMTAGVDPNDLDISIARDMVVIRGHREEEKTARTDDYFVQELYWGSFSRTISLPEEVDVDEADAVCKHGLLILKLPKLDKKRQTKLKVKTI
jgi:HSP20 family protein